MIIGEIGAVTVLAGGWSASQFDLAKLPGTVIAVNDSAVYAPRWDICISMDRLWSENRFDWMRKQKKPIWLRRSTIKNFEQLEHMTAFDNDHVSTILSDEEYLLNGTHSGFCALNLAYQMRPRDIYLVGFDMTRGPRGEKHWYAPYSWSQSTGDARLSEWSKQFGYAAKQCAAAKIDVYIAGAHTKVADFRHVGRAGLERASLCAA